MVFKNEKLNAAAQCVNKTNDNTTEPSTIEKKLRFPIILLKTLQKLINEVKFRGCPK